jgi:hypothetical protein
MTETVFPRTAFCPLTLSAHPTRPKERRGVTGYIPSEASPQTDEAWGSIRYAAAPVERREAMLR